jgi:hypothetical protein
MASMDGQLKKGDGSSLKGKTTFTENCGHSFQVSVRTTKKESIIQPLLSSILPATLTSWSLSAVITNLPCACYMDDLGMVAYYNSLV